MDAKEELKKLSVLRSQVDRLLERRRKILSMQNEQYKDVLIYHYMRFMTFEEVAEKMDVSLRHVYRLHREALKEYARL